jgi:hypothetical protein
MIFSRKREFGSPKWHSHAKYWLKEKLRSHPHQSESRQVRIPAKRNTFEQSEEKEMFKTMHPHQNENKTFIQGHKSEMFDNIRR